MIFKIHYEIFNKSSKKRVTSQSYAKVTLVTKQKKSDKLIPDLFISDK